VTAFRTVVLDVDSTVSAIEGIDWLASRRDADIAATVEALTAAAMDAQVPLDEVYGRRLALIRPTRDEIEALSAVYIEAAVPGARDAIRAWRAEGVHVVLVSGGLRDAILPLAAWLGIQTGDVHAVDVEYSSAVAMRVHASSPLAMRGGKSRVVASLPLARPILAVGDGATDADLVAVVDRFVAFTGVARREAVVAAAAGEVASFASLTQIVLGL
jgi:phosphoserine phosphatase